MNGNGARLAQQGAAMIAALFLIVVLAALGAFAVRIGVDQQQTANLQLMQYRARSAANAGLESWAYQTFTALPAPTPCPAAAAAPFVVGDFNVAVRCTRIDVDGSDYVYDVTADATIRTVAFGSPDFVRRSQSRRFSTFPAPGSWSR
jgi:MSHA biogenesis protein MshP